LAVTVMASVTAAIFMSASRRVVSTRLTWAFLTMSAMPDSENVTLYAPGGMAEKL
jgi:hypothetical protein